MKILLKGLKEKYQQKEFFYHTLNENHISSGGYKHTLNVWDRFDVENLGEYHDLCVKSNPFENFRKVLWIHFRL